MNAERFVLASPRAELLNILRHDGWVYAQAMLLLHLIKQRRVAWAEDGCDLSKETKEMR